MRATRLICALGAIGWMACGGDGDPPSSNAGGSGGSEGGSAGSAGSGAGSGAGGRDGSDTTGTGTGTGANDPCGPVLHAPRCLSGEWCWDGPGVLGGDLFAIDGTPAGDSIWAVGALGTAFRYCDGRWVPIETGVSVHLHDVFSPTRDFAIAVGNEGTAIVWNGHGWRRAELPTELSLRAVWGASPSDVWIGAHVSPPGDGIDNLFRFDGSKVIESHATSLAIRGLRGRSASDIYATGSWDLAPRADRYDGKTWTPAVISAGPDPGALSQLIFDAEKRAYALHNGASTGQVLADDRPGWVSLYIITYARSMAALHLDGAGTPSVVSSVDDPLMPGAVFKQDGLRWTMSDERFTVWPSEVWIGAGHGFAVAQGSALLARGTDGVWAQTPDVPAMLGEARYFGGASEHDAYFVSEHDIYRRTGGVWSAMARSKDEIITATQDPEGRLYVAARETLRVFENGSWRDLPHQQSGSFALYAFAPDDLWAVDQTLGYHFDGTQWTALYTLCDTVFDEVTRVRKAPDGKVWGVTDTAAVEFDLAARACTLVTRNDGLAGDDPLIDVAWSDSGQPWVLSRSGKLYARSGDALQPRLEAQAEPDGGERMLATALYAVPGDELRYLAQRKYPFEDRHRTIGRLVTIDVSGATPAATSEALPFAGVLWALDEKRTFIATNGGVLLRDEDAQRAPNPPAQGSGGATAPPPASTPSQPVRDETIFCDLPTMAGRPLVVPCTTALTFDKQWFGMAPSGTRCNSAAYYALDVINNDLRWARCLEDASGAWGTQRGDKILSDAELRDLLAGLQVMTLSEATPCATDQSKPLATVIVTTRTASTTYTDSHYGCGTTDKPFVDQIDAAFTTLDTFAR